MRKIQHYLLNWFKSIRLLTRLFFSVALISFISACEQSSSPDDDESVTPPPQPANVAPSVHAGNDVTADEGATVSLFGSASDSDGTIASYSWTQTAGIQVTIAGANTASASFTAPNTTQTLELGFNLTATDNDGTSNTASVSVTIEPVNTPPTVNAGNNASVDEETQVFLFGEASDSDGAVVSYAWEQTGGENVVLDTTDSATTSFMAPEVEQQTTLTFQLTATDNEGGVSSDSVDITITPVSLVYGATFVSQTVPTNLLPGETAAASVTFVNSGTVTWSSTNGFKLGSQNEQGNKTWGYSRVALTNDVEPGARYTFTFDITAPDDDGSYNFQWRMLEEQVQWFGDHTENVEILVVGEEPVTILLPVEVMGDNYTISSREFNLADKGNDAVSLWLQVNNLSYDNKASIRINNGSWHSISNGSVEVQEPEKSYGGIGSEVSTVRFVLSSSEFVNGENTVDFRFNEHDNHSNGYRVVNFNVLDNVGNKLIAESDFVEDDPNLWQAPISGSVAINNGKLLYETAQLNFPGTTVNMNAKCADCHLSTGFDLEYFSYSNQSIIERSKFHGLTQTEGEEIASYIRSLGVSRLGRPWNPPYQPGAELDGKSIDQWAAGAGLEAVLDHDTEMEQFLFPNGTSQAEVNKVVEFDSQLDVTELPIAIQLPDWKSWLPEVHGKDLWEQSDFENGEANESYENIRNTLTNGVSAQLVSSGDAKTLMNNFLASVKSWISSGRVDPNDGRTDAWGTRVGTVVDNRRSNYDLEFTKLNLAKWMSVKFFEFMHEHELEYLAHLDPEVPLADTTEGTRQWPGTDRTIFEVAPHFTAHNIINFPWQTEMEGKYMSSAWYQLQMLVHSGEYNQLRKGGPMDWSYHFLHIYDIEKQGGPTEGFRQITSLMKLWQTRSNDYVPDDLELGWRMRYVHLWWMISSDLGDESAMLSLNNNDPDLRAKIYNAVINEWVDQVRKIDLASWPRETGSWTKLDPVDYNPSEDNIVGINNRIFAGSKQLHADYFVRAIRMLADAGVDPATLQRLAQWCSEAWPNGNWFEHVPPVD